MMFRILENPKSQLWRDFDRVNEALTRSLVQNTVEIPVNVYLREEGAQLVALVPGLEEKDLEISVIENQVTFIAKRPEIELLADTKTVLKEISFGEATRTIHLPFRVDSEKVKATVSKGLLQVQAPKRLEDRPRKIEISAE